MLKFQNYRHYKLPITMNPLEYGKFNIKILIFLSFKLYDLILL